MKVSVLIITYQRTRLLEKCLASLAQQKPHSFNLHIFIYINGHDPKSSLLAHTHQLAPVVVNGPDRVTPAEARNRLIEKSSGDYILFLDDDVELPHDYLQRAQTYTNKEQTCFGGPDLLVPNATRFQKMLAASQKLWMSSAHTRYRHGAKVGKGLELKSGEELILCNLWLKREVLERHELKFDIRFFRNEENVLISQLLKFGQTCLFVPELYVFHYKKEGFKKAVNAIASSGEHRAMSFRLYPEGRRAIYFVPSIFVLFLVSAPWVEPRTSLIIVSFYLALGLFDSLKTVYKQDRQMQIVLGAWGLQIVTNMAYGVGFLRGLFRQKP